VIECGYGRGRMPEVFCKKKARRGKIWFRNCRYEFRKKEYPLNLSR